LRTIDIISEKKNVPSVEESNEQAGSSEG